MITGNPLSFNVLDLLSYFFQLFLHPDHQMIDLLIREDLRGRGWGTILVGEMEKMARQAGHQEMFLQVEPDNNARALKLYQRLGYEPIESRPVEDRWEFVDSAGVRHAGVEWIIHMRRSLV